MLCRKYNWLLLIIPLLGCGIPGIAPLPPLAPLPEDFKSFQKQDQNLFVDVPPYRLFFTDTLLCRLIDTALWYNYDLKIALLRVDQFRAHYEKAAGLRKPFVTAQAGPGFWKYGAFTQEGVGNFDTKFSSNIPANKVVPYPVLPNYNIGLNMSWEADIWKKLKQAKQAAFLRMQASYSGMQFFKTRIVEQVARIYYELLALDFVLKTLRENLEVQKKAVEIVQVQKESGYATALAVQQIEAQFITMQITLKEVERTSVALVTELNNWLGRTQRVIVRSKSSFMATYHSKLDSFPVSNQILLRRPDVVAAEQILSAAQLDVSAARKQFFPSLRLNAFLGFTSFSLLHWFNVTSLASEAFAGLAAPLINRSAIKAHYKYAEKERLIAFFNYQKATISAYNEVRQYLQQLNIVRQNYDFQKRRLRILDAARKTANDLYIANYANYLEIVTAQNAYWQAVLDVAHIKKQLWTLDMALYRALGGGWK